MKRATMILVGALLAGVPAACDRTSYSNSADTTAGLSVEASAHEIVTGETVTFVARTHDTYGRDAKVEWTSTAGSLKREEDGRIARVTFKEAGTYTVRATLSVDGKPVQTAMVEVRVKAIR